MCRRYHSDSCPDVMIVTFGSLADILNRLEMVPISAIHLQVTVLKPHDPLFSGSEHDAMMIQYRMTVAAIFYGRARRHIACICVLPCGERTGRVPAIQAAHR